MQNIKAEIVVTTADLAADTGFFADKLGMRLHEVFPADDPREALFAGHGCRMRLRRGEQASGTLRILADDPVLIAGGAQSLTSPGGVEVEIAALAEPVRTPPTEHAFVVRKLTDGAPWIVGRAGMQYRDLVPDRLGGSIIASHIRIPDAGPVPDMVHYHSVGFQLIYCYRGWVDLVYEDQGAPFRLNAGNCVIQPPEIRHRVLYASEGLEVIEIGIPAEHITTIDHDLELPTPQTDPTREWDGQRFVHHRADEAVWTPFRLPGFISRDSTVGHNTKGVAGVEVVRANGEETRSSSHTCDILFSFVLSGGMRLESTAQSHVDLTAGDAFVVPPGMKVRYAAPTDDFEMLEVALPAQFATSLEG